MDSTRRTSFVTGVLFIITFVTSIPAALVLYTPVLDDANFILGAGADGGVALGALLEVLLIIANVGTAVALFPILKRQNEALALGYVTARLVECTFIAIGIVSVLAVVTLRQDFAGAAGADPGSFVTVGKSLVAVHDWTFLLGPGFVVGVGNGLILGWLMYRSGLVPRAMAVLGLIAGPVPCCSASSGQTPRPRPSRPPRNSFGSCRSASTSWSRASGHPGSSVSRPIAGRFQRPTWCSPPSRVLARSLEGDRGLPSRTGLIHPYAHRGSNT
jgi:hypothetical protein